MGTTCSCNNWKSGEGPDGVTHPLPESGVDTEGPPRCFPLGQLAARCEALHTAESRHELDEVDEDLPSDKALHEGHIHAQRHISHAKINSTDDPPCLSPFHAKEIDPNGGFFKPEEEIPVGADKDVVKADRIARLERLVDMEYDILKAEKLLGELEEILGPGEELEAVLTSPVCSRLARKVEIFHEVGRHCLSDNPSWFCVHEDTQGTIHACLDSDDKSVLHFRVRQQMPVSLSNIVVISNEVQLLPQWNSLVVNKPEAVGRRTAHYMVINYQMSLLHGLHKLDVLNEIRRFSDPDGGFVAEFVQTCAKDHPSYREPRSGFKRASTQSWSIWVACGNNHSAMIQTGRMRLPFSVSKWVATTAGGLVGRWVLGGLVKNALKAEVPGNPWEAPFNEDKLGLYARLKECISSDSSQKRSPKKAAGGQGKVGDLNLGAYFSEKRFQRHKREDTGAPAQAVAS